MSLDIPILVPYRANCASHAKHGAVPGAEQAAEGRGRVSVKHPARLCACDYPRPTISLVDMGASKPSGATRLHHSAKLSNPRRRAGDSLCLDNLHPLTDGRHLVRVMDGEVTDAAPVSAVVCMIDPTNAVQITTMMLECVAPGVRAKVLAALKAAE